MRMVLKLAAAMLTALGFGAGAGVAHAQGPAAPPSPPPPLNAGLSVENSQVRNGGDTYERDAMRARDEAVARERSNRGAGGVAAKPEDIVVGAEVRDPRGLLIGTIESVSMSAAVVVTPAGKVEVPLEAFGKNRKGLMLSMSKADFDKAVAEANRPAN